jgi:hypothetical protein
MASVTTAALAATVLGDLRAHSPDEPRPRTRLVGGNCPATYRRLEGTRQLGAVDPRVQQTTDTERSARRV